MTHVVRALVVTGCLLLFGSPMLEMLIATSSLGKVEPVPTPSDEGMYR